MNRRLHSLYAAGCAAVALGCAAVCYGQSPGSSAADANPGFISAAKKSVVTVTAYSRSGGSSQVRVGTGFIYHRNGFIISMRSVIKNSEDIYITLPDGSVVPGRVLDLRSQYGLVLIKIEGENHPVLPRGRSSQLNRMSILTVIGNSLGVFPSLTLASYLGRERNGFLDLGAIIPPGNCGSPVLDQRGRLAGIIIGRVFDNPESSVTKGKIGVAIPIELIRHEVDDLVSYYNTRRGWIGLTVENIENSDYVRITRIAEGGPSAQAGLAVGDTIVMYEGRRLNGVADLKERVIRNAPGTKITFTLKKGSMQISHLVHVHEE